jgi:hypothetical protein
MLELILCTLLIIWGSLIALGLFTSFSKSEHPIVKETKTKILDNARKRSEHSPWLYGLMLLPIGYAMCFFCGNPIIANVVFALILCDYFYSVYVVKKVRKNEGK